MAKDERPTPQEPSAESNAAPERDVAIIHSATADGNGLNVIRCRADRVEVGALRPLKEGAPIMGEVVKLTPRPDMPRVCDVEVQLPAPAAAAPEPTVEAQAGERRGPAQIASAAYRRNWDQIWSRDEPKLMN